MEYSQVILEMLDRIKTLENKVKALEEQLAEASAQEQVQLNNVSMKYRPLAEYLLASRSPRVSLSYPKIEEILGFTLPSTAHNFMASFWANTKTHSYASSWLGVGYKAKVDQMNEVIHFVKQSQMVD